MIHLLEEKPSNEVAKFAMENSEEEVDLVAAMIRSDAGGWNLSVVDEPAQDGRHFIDILEPCIGNFVRKHIPGAPRRQKVAFAMEKGAVFDLPQSNQMQSISACLGWDVVGDGVDLDVSAVLLTSDGRPIDAVFFGNLSAHGLEHSGDNLTGEGSGDDERIVCNLDQIPKQASQIFFVVNIYTRGVTFERVSNAYCRIVDSSEIELARYSLSEGQQQNGLLISRLFREVDGRWGFQAIGSFARGRTWKDALPDIQATFGQRPQALQLRGASTMMFSGGAGGYESSPSPSAPPPLIAPALRGARPVQGAQGQECCNVQ
jgi:tellurium resistance protein TerZ